MTEVCLELQQIRRLKVKDLGLAADFTVRCANPGMESLRRATTAFLMSASGHVLSASPFPQMLQAPKHSANFLPILILRFLLPQGLVGLSCRLISGASLAASLMKAPLRDPPPKTRYVSELRHVSIPLVVLIYMNGFIHRLLTLDSCSRIHLRRGRNVWTYNPCHSPQYQSDARYR